MPELPDVEAFRRYAESTSLHQKIEGVEVPDQDMLKVSKKKLGQHLSGTEFTKTDRIGKYLFLSASDKGWLVFHFGMTGELKYYKDSEKQPDHSKLLINFDNGYHLSYRCTRKLGEINYTSDLSDFIKTKELGPDALQIEKEDFIDKVRSRKGAIKPLLMKQDFIAGLGNIYIDEILLQTKIHPKTKANEINEDRLKTVYKQMHKVLKKATECLYKSKPFPDHFLLNHRDEGAKCPSCNGKIKKITVGGRSTYYCPKCQKP